MSDPKVVSFPKSRAPRKAKTDTDHCAEIKKAWRALERAVHAAQNSGLDIDYGQQNINFYNPPRVSRRYK
jgi:hypothetical protein